MRKHRFDVQPLAVTGSTPDELEASAIAAVSAATGIDTGLLAITSPYKVYITASNAEQDEDWLGRPELMARADGSPLSAWVPVSAWTEVDDEHGTVGGGPDSTGASADLRYPAGPVQAGRPTSLEARARRRR
jgi:hypothetical protein